MRKRKSKPLTEAQKQYALMHIKKFMKLTKIEREAWWKPRYISSIDGTEINPSDTPKQRAILRSFLPGAQAVVTPEISRREVWQNEKKSINSRMD